VPDTSLLMPKGLPVPVPVLCIFTLSIFGTENQIASSRGYVGATD
jgi:hypothetical protein